MNKKFEFVTKLVLTVFALLSILSCGGGGGGGGTPSTPGVTLASISVTTANQTVATGSTLQFTATGTYSDYSIQDITKQVNWSSSNTSVATMSTTTAGFASAVGAGSATIKASVGGVSGISALTVVNPTLVSISVMPPNAVVAKGQTTQLTAIGNYSPSFTRDLTSQVTWTTSNPGIASMSTITAGLVSGLANGTTTITVTDHATSITGSTGLSVLPLMGGAIQGGALTLSDVVSTLAGTLGGSYYDSTGTAAWFNKPAGVTTDGTNLYVADTSNNVIRKVVIATGQVTTLAGSAGIYGSGSADGTGSAAKFMNPYGITTDGTNLYVADTDNCTIRQVVIATGRVTTLAGSPGACTWADGTGSAAYFYYPAGITTDGINLYIADSGNEAIRQIVISTGVVTTIAGLPGVVGDLDTSPSITAQFNSPSGVTTDGTNLYIADTGNNSIRQMVIATGQVTTLAGWSNEFGGGFVDGTGTGARFHLPYGITTDGSNLYVADTYNAAVRQIVISSAVVTTVDGLGGCGSTDGGASTARFCYPYGIVTDGKSLIVGDTTNNEIRQIK